MHRLKTLIALTALVLPIAIIACGGGNKKPAKTSHDDSQSEDAGTDDTFANSGGNAAADGGGSECTGFDEPKLDEALMKIGCEMKDMTAGQGSVDMKDKLEIRVMPFPTKVQPGGIMEIVVSFVNKSKEPLTLYFQINPEPHFTIEAYSEKGNKRVDMPSGNPPPFPKDMIQPQGAEPKIAKYTLAPNGSGKVKLNWQASRMKWDPSKVKGAILDRGYPRAPAGPLPKGKYTLRIITPLVGVFEGVEHEVSAPKIPIEVN